MKMLGYKVILEKGETSIGAFRPDLPGSVAVGATRPEVRRLLREALGLHLAAMKLDGDFIQQ